jgi:hypothetical protein
MLVKAWREMAMWDDMTRVTAGMARQPAWPHRHHLAQRPPGPSAEIWGRTPSRHPLLAGRPWSLRTAVSTDGKRALEVYAAGSLIDVMVAHSLGSRLLRGACTIASAGHHHSIAWGCLPQARDVPPLVEFVAGRIRPRPQAQSVEVVSAAFWIAAAEERFSQVVVTSQAERASCRVRRAQAC